MPSLSSRTLVALLALSSVQGFTTAPNNNNNARLSRYSTTSTALNGESNPKDPHRAHIERILEEAMDNDWRVFRAKLVAQEKAENDRLEQLQKNAKNSFPVSSSSSSSPEEQSDAKLARQTQIGDLFAGALQSIFKSKGAPPEPPSDTSISAGGLVGGAHFMENTSPSSDRSLHNNENNNTINNKMIRQYIKDPFVTEDELPLFLPKTHIDKHRWAHEITNVEPGAVLVANEKLGGVFHQTVVLVIEHHETTGTLGVIINRPLEGDLRKIALEPKAKVDLSVKMAFQKAPVAYGGPVLTEEFNVLHSFGEVEGARKLFTGVYIGGSEELIDPVRLGTMDPRHALFVKGHAAWVPGQLNRELQKGVWYVAAVCSDFILRYAGVKLTKDDNPNDLWSDILCCMGSKFEDIARRHGGTGDFRRVMP